MTQQLPPPEPNMRPRFSHEHSSTVWFPRIVLALAAIGLLVAGALLINGRGTARRTPAAVGVATDSTATGANAAFGQGAPDPNVPLDELISSTARAMGAVTSVEFDVERTGSPVYIDQFQSIALDHLRGQFMVPSDAQATVDVTVNGALNTRVGAVALGDEVWMSNPLTGKFEPLPPQYNIDPSGFFNPTGGWQPLIAHLRDVTLVETDDHAYHLTGTAAAADVTAVTVGLVRDQDLPVDFWVDAATSLVTQMTFDSTVPDGTATWNVRLDKYGANFTITTPEGVTE